MAHDHNGRVGPPRCEECNAPLTSDERRLGTTGQHSFCQECDLILNAFAEPALFIDGHKSFLGGNS